tara:strand:+ start:181 stop:552 length:372 start_codon:yes stop_codon:yes gene_type:complete
MESLVDALSRKTLTAWTPASPDGYARRHYIESGGEPNDDTAAVFVWPHTDPDTDAVIAGKWRSGPCDIAETTTGFVCDSRDEAMRLIDGWLVENGYELLSVAESVWLFGINRFCHGNPWKEQS